MTECISLPSPVSESTSITSTSRQRAPARRYSPSPARSSRRTIETSGAPKPSVPSLSSSTSSTSAPRPPWRPGAPPKITSCMDCPRTASGDCSPSAHSTASVMFDLPEPFGPTITLTPGPNSSRVRSGNDLKPLRMIDFKYMPVSLEPLEGHLCRLLLGVLLAPAAPTPDLDPADRGAHREHPVVGRALLLDHVVGDERSLTGQPLLEG